MSKNDDCEIVLVDDGSKDTSFQIAKKLSEQYENIKCYVLRKRRSCFCQKLWD